MVIFTLWKKILSFLAVGTILERLLSECVSYYSGYGILLFKIAVKSRMRLFPSDSSFLWLKYQHKLNLLGFSRFKTLINKKSIVQKKLNPDHVHVVTMGFSLKLNRYVVIHNRFGFPPYHCFLKDSPLLYCHLCFSLYNTFMM